MHTHLAAIHWPSNGSPARTRPPLRVLGGRLRTRARSKLPSTRPSCWRLKMRLAAARSPRCTRAKVPGVWGCSPWQSLCSTGCYYFTQWCMVWYFCRFSSHASRLLGSCAARDRHVVDYRKYESSGLNLTAGFFSQLRASLIPQGHACTGDCIFC